MKKLYEIVDNSKRKTDGIEVGGKQVRFNANGVCHTTDRRFAEDVQNTIGQDGKRDVIVIDVPNYNERGITMFSLPSGDWKSRIDWSK